MIDRPTIEEGHELHLAFLFIAKKRAEILQKIAALEAERDEINKAVEVCKRFGLFIDEQPT